MALRPATCRSAQVKAWTGLSGPQLHALIIIAVGDARPGKRNDVVVFRETVGKTLPDHPRLSGDGGYQGIERIRPPRRGPDRKIIKDRAYRRLRKRRAIAEHTITRLKDEKTSIQARCRCHPTLAPGQARAMRVNHTYGRGGALAYLAAYDVHQARVFGRTEPRTGIDPFMNLVTQVMSQEPYASVKRVFWIVDNGSSHRGQNASDRLTAAFPNAVLVHTPVHASWLNQVEIYFSVVQRKVVSPNDFPT
jgi:hypothetical protein